MPFKPTTGLIAFICIIILIIVVVVAISGGGGNKPSSPQGQLVCTVNGDVGVSVIKITNANTGNSITKTAADLPFSFNFTKGDTLQFNVTVLSDYEFNAWMFTTGTFNNHNPLVLKTETPLIMTADCIVKGLQP